MGIPSYFRRILQKYPGCLSNSTSQSDVLCFDFNCLIYRCLYSKNIPQWSEDINDEWEELLLQEICRTVKEVYNEAGSPRQVYIAVDGVVPMAKIRQQRVRRFKAILLKVKEGWDSNAITPGTLFMAKLSSALDAMCKRHVGWKLSDSNEPGEGEHKIMQWLRASKISSAVVYGLDADLILLTALVSEEKKISISLMRETQEFEKKGSSDSSYTFLHLNEFKLRLGIKSEEECLNYIGLMSLMGNDFLPHSLTHSLKNNGHDYVMREFDEMKKKNIWLIDSVKKEVNWNLFYDIIRRLSKDEKEKMLDMIVKKQQQAARGVLDGMDESEGLPLTWAVENQLLTSGNLISNWKDECWKMIGGAGSKRDVCREYRVGFQWIIDYYTGKQVNKEWMFPLWVPPFWSDMLEFNDNNPITQTCDGETKDIEPVEQLAMVLPLKSWGLIRDKNLKQLPVHAPQYWPLSFEFFSLGRKWLWECEAVIPPLTAARLRSILIENN